MTTTADSDAGSLRQAVADAQAGDTVSLAGVSGTIALASAINLSKNLTVTGPGAAALTVTTQHASQAFFIGSGHDVALSNVTVADSGTSGNLGGAIYDDGQG